SLRLVWSTLFPYTTLFRSQKSDLFTKVLAKPPVRKLAKDHGVDLAGITPTGQHGEVTRSDVQSVLDGAKPAATAPKSGAVGESEDRKSTRLNSSHVSISYA